MDDTKDLAPGLLRITAPNPSPMTYHGTQTYILGSGARAVIDPGPDDPAHLQAILRACPDGISHIFVTHAHRDHSALAPALSECSGAPVLAYGPAVAGRSEVMSRLVAEGMQGGGEGVDAAFSPDITLSDGQTVAGEGWHLTALWSPGHTSNHICLAWGDSLFSGDHVMGWATSIVSPPDGDMAQFRASCRGLKGRGLIRAFPGHGDPVDSLENRLDWLIAHRQQREAQILAALGEAPGTPAAITQAVYTDVAPHLWPMAERNVFAHLVDLAGQGRVTCTPSLSLSASFSTLV